jgi:NADH:ubiquinone oxidoreductase subunit E
VYLLDEAKKLVEVMRQHQEQKLYLTVKDSETIAKLFEVMEQPETNEHERANNEKNTQTPC